MVGAATGVYLLADGEESSSRTAADSGERDAIAESAPLPADEVAPEEAAAAPDLQETATTPATPDEEAAPGGTVQAETAPDPNTPTGVIRAHWSAIGDGDYERAFEFFSSEYRARTSESGWTADHADYAPEVHVRLVRYLQALPNGQAFVFADVYTRDTGSSGDSSVCNRFAGKMRVVRQGGTWRYWPAAPGDTWGRKGSLSRSDSRCP